MSVEQSMRERVARRVCCSAGCIVRGEDLNCVAALTCGDDADAILADFAQFLRERSARKQARALDVEQTITEMMS